MNDKFSLYQTDGLWGIIENASDKKQTSIKSYFGSDLIIKRLNEQADQINQLKQQNEELMLQLNRQNVEEHKPVYCTLAGTECEYLGKVEELKQQLAEKDKEIERLNTIKNNAIECADLFKVALSVRQKDLAIQELEKVKKLLLEESKRYPIVYDITDDLVGGAIDKDKTFEIIDNQIKELKGEKDVED